MNLTVASSNSGFITPNKTERAKTPVSVDGTIPIGFDASVLADVALRKATLKHVLKSNEDVFMRSIR